jgi:hypothetical protein
LRVGAICAAGREWLGSAGEGVGGRC